MPVVTMIAGPNGSGKSTLTRELERLGISLGRYLNADDIAATMKGDPRLIAAAAQQVVRDRRATALKNGIDHSFETVMSHPSHIDHLLAARAAGFVTRLFFVATEDPFINEGRVANRVKHGGHDVPLEKIGERYHRCFANLPAAIAAADEGLIYDNSRIDQPLIIVARISDGELFAYGLLKDAPRWWLSFMEANKLQLSPSRKIERR